MINDVVVQIHTRKLNARLSKSDDQRFVTPEEMRAETPITVGTPPDDEGVAFKLEQAAHKADPTVEDWLAVAREARRLIGGEAGWHAHPPAPGFYAVVGANSCSTWDVTNPQEHTAPHTRWYGPIPADNHLIRGTSPRGEET